MINIPLKDLPAWFYAQLDRKYSLKLYSFKRTFTVFYNISDQLIILYESLYSKMQAYSNKEEYKDIICLLSKSLGIIEKLTEEMPSYIDADFCQWFIKTFDFSINLLCTYYHSLNHFYILNKEAKFEKDKLVYGINKLYSLQTKIKESFRHDTIVFKSLTLFSYYKKIIANKVASIQAKIHEQKYRKGDLITDFEKEVANYYKYLKDKMALSSSELDAKKSLLSAYFQLQHQMCSTQAQLYVLMEVPIRICEYIKNRKKNVNFVISEYCTQFTRWLTILLKPNVSIKSIRKIKPDEFIKCVHGILKEREPKVAASEDSYCNYAEISALLYLILDVAKELEKVYQSGMMTLVTDYKYSVLPIQTKNFVRRLTYYQQYMVRFYALHYYTKQLQGLAQSIILEETGYKVNIVFDL